MSLFNLPSPLDNVFANTDNLPVFFDRLMFGMVELNSIYHKTYLNSSKYNCWVILSQKCLNLWSAKKERKKANKIKFFSDSR